MPNYRVSMDIGGTFTDIVAYDQAAGTYEATKASTTPGNLSAGVIAVRPGQGSGGEMGIKGRGWPRAGLPGEALFLGALGARPAELPIRRRWLR